MTSTKALTKLCSRRTSVVVKYDKYQPNIPVRVERKTRKISPFFSMGTKIEGKLWRTAIKSKIRADMKDKHLDKTRPHSLRFHKFVMEPVKHEQLFRKNIVAWTNPYGNIKMLDPRQLMETIEKASTEQKDNSVLWRLLESSACRALGSYHPDELSQIFRSFHTAGRQPRRLLASCVRILPEACKHYDELPAQVNLLESFALLQARYSQILSPLCSTLRFADDKETMSTEGSFAARVLASLSKLNFPHRKGLALSCHVLRTSLRTSARARALHEEKAKARDSIRIWELPTSSSADTPSLDMHGGVTAELLSNAISGLAQLGIRDELLAEYAVGHAISLLPQKTSNLNKEGEKFDEESLRKLLQGLAPCTDAPLSQLTDAWVQKAFAKMRRKKRQDLAVSARECGDFAWNTIGAHSSPFLRQVLTCASSPLQPRHPVPKLKPYQRKEFEFFPRIQYVPPKRVDAKVSQRALDLLTSAPQLNNCQNEHRKFVKVVKEDLMHRLLEAEQAATSLVVIEPKIQPENDALQLWKSSTASSSTSPAPAGPTLPPIDFWASAICALHKLFSKDELPDIAGRVLVRLVDQNVTSLSGATLLSVLEACDKIHLPDTPEVAVAMNSLAKVLNARRTRICASVDSAIGVPARNGISNDSVHLLIRMANLNASHSKVLGDVRAARRYINKRLPSLLLEPYTRGGRISIQALPKFLSRSEALQVLSAGGNVSGFCRSLAFVFLKNAGGLCPPAGEITSTYLSTLQLVNGECSYTTLVITKWMSDFFMHNAAKKLPPSKLLEVWLAIAKASLSTRQPRARALCNHLEKEVLCAPLFSYIPLSSSPEQVRRVSRLLQRTSIPAHDTFRHTVSLAMALHGG